MTRSLAVDRTQIALGVPIWLDAQDPLDTQRRIQRLLVAQDTTEFDLTRRQERVGGPLNDESRWGLYAHPQLAMTPDR